MPPYPHLQIQSAPQKMACLRKLQQAIRIQTVAWVLQTTRNIFPIDQIVEEI
jgi:hypothetical protein